MGMSATQFQYGPFAERFETLETLYLDPGFSLLRAKDRQSSDEVRIQLMHLPSLEGKGSLPLQWQAIKACRDSLWVRPQEWLEKNHFGILISWVPPGRYFNELSKTLPDEVYLKWMKEALQDLNQLHRHGLLHLAQQEKTWILFRSDEEEGEETMGLSNVTMMTEVPLGHAVSPAAMVAVPPEVLKGAEVDARADLYSLAALILRQRSSHLFERSHWMKDNLEFHWGGRLREMVPDSETTLNDLLRKMLQPNPADRPSNAGEALALLDPQEKSVTSRSRTFPEWSAQRTKARQNTLILNTLLTLIDHGETDLSEEMLKYLESYLKVDHESYLRYLQARWARQKGQLEAADEFRRQATVKCYSQPDPKLKSLLHLEEAHVLWEQGKLKEAVLSLDESWEAIEKYPEPNLQIRVLYERARVRKKLGEDTEALEELKQAFDRIPEKEEHPSKAQVYAELAEVLSSYGVARQAQPLIDQALTHLEEDPREGARRFLQAGLVALAVRDWEKALGYFTEARYLYSRLKDLAALIWSGAHGVRVPLAQGDYVQARRELKSLINRNRTYRYHQDLLDLLELELWLETGKALRPVPDSLLDRIKEKSSRWLGRECFCDLGWPRAKTSDLLDRAYQKLKRYPEAMRFANQTKKCTEAMAQKLETLGYPKENLHPGKPELVSVTSVKVESLITQEGDGGKKEGDGARVAGSGAPLAEKGESAVTSRTYEEWKTLKSHAHYLETQIHHLEDQKEGLLRDNMKLNREIEALKEQLALTQEKEIAQPAPKPMPESTVEGRQSTVEEKKPSMAVTEELKPPKPKRISSQAPKGEQAPGGTERDQIFQALKAAQGNRSRAAKALGIHRRTLFQKMKKYGLEDEDFLPGKEEIEAALAEVAGNRSKAAKRLGMSRSTFYRRMKDLGL